MEFWGVEVKPGASLKVVPEENKLIHISQAALGEVKNNKGAENVPLRLKIDDSKFMLGTLSAVTRPQIVFDLVFEKEFELSHDWKNGSVFLCGYSSANPYADEGFEDGFSSGEEFSSEDEEIIPEALENGKVEPKAVKEKPAKSTAAPAKPESSTKPSAPVVLKKDEDDSDDVSDDEDDSDDAPELGSDDMSEDDGSDSSDDEDDESDESDEETPKKLVSAKKRPSESALKTPVQAKKTKTETPQKTDGKKSGGHTATPHPSKKKAAEKTPASKKGKEQQSPKSSSSIKCNSCAKTFNSDGAREAHTKAKHSAAK